MRSRIHGNSWHGWATTVLAALIYMHSSDERQRALAEAVANAALSELAKSKKGQDC